MKKLLFFLALAVVSFARAESEKPIVSQTVCYSNEDASEVFIVWGVNNWQQIPRAQWPAGSVEKQHLICTPMRKIGGNFFINLPVQQGTQLDYVFWITKGPFGVACDQWDVNRKPQKDYHTIAMNDNTTIIRSTLKIRSASELSVLHFGKFLLSISLLALLIVYLVRRNKFEPAQKPSPLTTVAGISLILFLFCMFARVSASGISWELYYDTWKTLPRALYAAYYDYFFIVAFTLMFGGLILVSQRFPRIQKMTLVLFIIVSCMCLTSSMLHIRVMEILKKPFNLRWLYYSDFLQSADAKAAATFNLSGDFIRNFLLVLFAAAVSSLIVIYCLQFASRRRLTRRITLLVMLFLNLSYVVMAHTNINSWPKHKVVNPIIAFASSVNSAEGHDGLYSMTVADSLQFKSTLHKSNDSPRRANIRNVIVMVLESTPAEYVQPYANRYQVTPVLAGQLNHAIVFDHVYAHAPATNKSLVSLLASNYPWLSYHSITNDHPNVKMATISEELKKAGYRTAFFNAADNRFQKTGEYLEHRGFDMVRDCHSLGCSTRFSEPGKNWEPLDGVSDACAADKLLEWVQADPQKNFFAVYWTCQTHYPYYGSSKNVLEPYDTTLNRYLNAVHNSDAVLGNILAGLEASGKLDETLVVVIGDHGEAFGRHGQTTHASRIYEENVHVPCVFINPQFQPERSGTLGGLVDIAPSIMHLLGRAPAASWQGQSLFATNRHQRTYFFSPWSDYLFGFREGNLKFIYNASTDSCEVYDLAADPSETKNIASRYNLALLQQKLAGWVQYQHKHMQTLLAAK